MTSDLVIIGCGGFGREIVGIIDAINSSETNSPVWNLIGFLDDSPSAEDTDRVTALGHANLGPVDKSSIPEGSAPFYVIGIGSGRARHTVSERAESIGLTATTLVDPSAVIGRDVRIGDGSIISAHTHVTTNVTLGKHVHLDRAVQVGHDSLIGDFSTVHPMAVVSGNCKAGKFVEFGTNSTILPSVEIGDGCRIGAASCVVHNVQAGSTVKGIPAR